MAIPKLSHMARAYLTIVVLVKVNNQHPSDIMCFLGETKSQKENHKKVQLRSFCCWNFFDLARKKHVTTLFADFGPKKDLTSQRTLELIFMFLESVESREWENIPRFI